MNQSFAYPPLLLAALTAGALLVFGPPDDAYGQEAAAKGPEFTGYDPSPVYPNGRPNPAAPEELHQFHFMVGQNACLDRIRQPDGTYRAFASRWNAKYFLNGFGIQDEYWADSFATTNLRIFDPVSGSWKVTFARMPGYFVGTWEGRMEGREMVLRRLASEQNPERPSTGRLVFFNISPEGFEWKAENLNPQGEAVINWSSICEKIR